MLANNNHDGLIYNILYNSLFSDDLFELRWSLATQKKTENIFWLLFNEEMQFTQLPSINPHTFNTNKNEMILTVRECDLSHEKKARWTSS